MKTFLKHCLRVLLLKMILPNSKVTKIYGSSIGDEIGILPKLVEFFPDTAPEKWLKCRGETQIIDDLGAVFISEIHFYYNENVGGFEYKFPTRLAKEWRL